MSQKKRRNRNQPTALAPALRQEEKQPRFFAQVVSPWDEQFGVEAPSSSNPVDLLGSYGAGRLANVWVYRAVRAKADAVSQLKLLFQERTRNGKEEWRTVLDGPIPVLFRDINPLMSYFDYSEQVCSFMELAGNCFLALENPSPQSKLPREIWPIRPDIVRIHPNPATGEVLGYTVHMGQGAAPILYQANEMIHFKFFNPTNWYWGLSPLSAHRMGLTFNYYVNQFENNFFRHGTRESGILVTGGQLNDIQFERLRRQVESRYGGVEQFHRPMLLEGGLDWKRTSVPPKDMEYLSMRKWNRKEVGAIFGLPPLKLMELEEASVLANAEVQERIFWTDSIIPLLRKYEGYYAEFLLPIFLKPADLPYYRMVFDLNSIRAFQLDEKGKAEVATRLTSGTNPLMSPNEARDRFYGLSAVPWGQEPLVPSTLLPASMLAGGTVQVQEQLAAAIVDRVMEKVTQELGALSRPALPAPAAVTPSPLPQGTLKAISEKAETCEDLEAQAKDPYGEDYIWSLVPEFEISAEHQAYWRDWAIKRLKEEDRFTKALNAEFKVELAETLAALSTYTESQEILSTESLLFDETRAIGAMTDLWLSQFGFIMRDVSAEEQATWGLANPIDFESPTVIEYGKNQASWFAGPGRAELEAGEYPGVTGTQLGKLERTLNEGLAKGDSIPELTQRVRQVFEGTIREKGYAARRIARTETIRIANHSRLVQYQRNRDVVEARQWIAQLDSKTEEICATLHGLVAPLGEPFPGGYQQPPDPHCFIDSQVPIYTSQGWRPIGKIKQGDLVLTHKGRFRKVIHTPQHKANKGTKLIHILLKDRIYRLNLVVHRKITITTKHPILVHGKGWVKAENLHAGDKVIFLADKKCSCGKDLPIDANFSFCSSVCARKSDLTKSKISSSLKNFYASPIEREKRSKEMKVFFSDASNLDAMKEKIKDFWRENPRREEARKRIRKKIKENYETGVVNRYEITKSANRKIREIYERGEDYGFRNSERLTKAKQSLGRRAYGKTWIEEKMGWYLTEVLGLKIEPQYRVEGPLFDKTGKYNSPGRRRYYFIDFAIADKKIAIECDGEYFHGNKEKDKIRQQWLEQDGWTVVRFPGNRIKTDLASCGEEIRRIINNHNGKYRFGVAEIEKIEISETKSNVRLYNLSVDEDDSYIAKGVVVHNSNCRCVLIPRLREVATQGESH